MPRLPIPSSLAALLAVTMTLAEAPLHAEDARPPNIIYIFADDLGYGELGSYGQQRIRTPHLDRLAAEGMRFTQHYTASPVCAPARASLMLGLHGGNAPVRDNREVQPLGQMPIPVDSVTIASLLRERGYATAAIGKWGLGPPGSTGDPNRHGFDLFFGNNCQRNAHTYYPPFLWRNERKVELGGNEGIPRHFGGRLSADDHEAFERFKGETYSPDLMLEESLRFIRDHRDEPFFLYYPSLIPHLALQIPDAELEPYLALGWEDEPYLGGRYVPHRHPRTAYAAMVSRLDLEVGRIMALLDELGLDENTIVMFTSDNGPSHLDQVDTDFFDSAGGLRGFKGSVYEGGIRVPMIARWPGRIEAGAVTDLPSYLPDVMPTLLELAGHPGDAPEGIDGTSFAPTLLGEPERQETHEFMVWEFHGYGGQQAVRAGDWKGVRRDMNAGNMRIELYNLADDPAETTDLADRHPGIVERIERVMAEQRTASEHFRFPALDGR